MVTSGTYNFGAVPGNRLIDDAYERIGIIPSPLTGQQLISALNSINLLLSDWSNRGLNLWTVTRDILTLKPNQIEYILPPQAIDILDSSVMTSVRELNGTAFASSGVAQNAFDGNSATACTQTAINGFIGYDWGVSNKIMVNMVGVQSNQNRTYTLVFEWSNDNVNWTTALALPAYAFILGENKFFEVTIPAQARYFRMRETGGATLDIQELYFNDNIIDYLMSAISRSAYEAITNKYVASLPITYYINRQIRPIIKLWPMPSSIYNAIVYNYKRTIQDAGALIDTPEIPQRFFEALCAGLAYRLSIKLKPEVAPLLKQEYQEAFDRAAREDTEKYIPMSFDLDFARWR